jgi:RimJ/RimL family protein N-acetyltransferase
MLFPVEFLPHIIDEMRNAEIGIPGEWFQIAIAQKHTNALLGDMGMQVKTEDSKTVEIGFTLDFQEQGKGYALEAGQALIWLLFEVAQINKIIAITDAKNEASIKLLKRLGLKFVGSNEIEFRGELCCEYSFELEK